LSELIKLEMELAVPRPRLWKAWTEEAELTRWLAVKARVRVEKGGPYELFWNPAHPDQNSTIGCVITELQVQEKLAFEWRGPVHLADLMNAKPSPTCVVVEFADAGQHGSRLCLSHYGWGEGARWHAARAWQQQAWSIALSRLKQYLAN
jgi:uncharacterized protein YndB with AHSA1/START domain